jgi:hypothetical protein
VFYIFLACFSCQIALSLDSSHEKFLAYITHKGMQNVTRVVLMVLARYSICRELAQMIIGKFAELMAQKQLNFIRHFLATFPCHQLSRLE